MVRHQPITEYFPTILFHCGLPAVRKSFIISIVAPNILAPVPAGVGDMIYRIGVFDTKGTSHCSTLPRELMVGKRK